MKHELQHAVLELIDDGTLSREAVLDNLVEVMVHVTLQVPNNKPVSQIERRRAYRALCYLLESKLEGNIQRSWRHEKFERLSGK